MMMMTTTTDDDDDDNDDKHYVLRFVLNTTFDILDLPFTKRNF